jgi:hypothetical protein
VEPGSRSACAEKTANVGWQIRERLSDTNDRVDGLDGSEVWLKYVVCIRRLVVAEIAVEKSRVLWRRAEGISGIGDREASSINVVMHLSPDFGGRTMM